MIAIIQGQLGNQMFIYASTKCISKKNNYTYKCLARFPSTYKDIDPVHGRNLYEVFSGVNDPIISEVDNESFVFTEDFIGRKMNYLPSVYQLKDNTVLDGVFQSPLYFDEYRDEVKKWFSFYDDTKTIAEKELLRIKKTHPNNTICFVHFRQGKDYRHQGYALSFSYYSKALKYMNARFNGLITFVVFGDVVPDRFKRKLNKYSCEYIRGSLATDLCLMTLCDAGIIANSSFSWWGAYLQDNQEQIIRPSKYFLYGTRICPDDIFPSEWIIQPSKKTFESFSFGIICSLTNNFRKWMRLKHPRATRKLSKLLYGYKE